MEKSKSTHLIKKKKELKLIPIYSTSLITRNISLSINQVGKNVREIIEKCIAFNFEGKCIVEGYIRPNSTKIVSFSSGLIDRGTSISFEVVFECEICYPVEGMLIQCVAKNITKAGIRCESLEEKPSPIVVFIARDHHYNNNYFNSVQEDDKITIRVIGQRFELNDKFISIIGELVMPMPHKNNEKLKLVIEN